MKRPTWMLKPTWPNSLPTSPPARRLTLAKRAGVEKLILTHISRRYREKEVIAEAQSVFPGAIVARDFDTIQVKRD